MVRKPVTRGRRALITVIAAAGVLLLAAVPVQVTGTGIDLFALLCAAVVLLAVERTLGDWVANLLGPAGTALAFAVVAAAGVAYLLSDGGQKRAHGFLAAAEAHGYRPAYFKSHPDEKPEETAGSKVPRIADPPVNPSPVQTAPTPARSATEPSATGQGAAGSGASAPKSQTESGWRFFPSRSASRDSATARLTLDPDLAQVGDEVVVRFRIIGTAGKPPSDVSFYANGVLLGRVSVESDGSAEARWRPRAPGQYHLLAVTSASSLGETSFRATAQVLPRAR